MMKLFYYYLYVTSRIIVQIYYRTTFLSKEHFKLPKGALIMTSNHPNTLIDPMATVAFVNRESHFLANAGLFKMPIMDWLLRKMWCIPIKRRKDDVNHISNDTSFEACDKFLTNGGMLFIAPEGSSYNERHVRDFRPGTAKIAFSAEALNDFKLGLHICCFGLSYERPYRFRSRLFVNAAAPIRVADYRDMYEKDPDVAIDFLTQVIENQTRVLVTDATNFEQDRLAAKIEIIADTPSLKQKNNWIEGEIRLKRSQAIVANLKKMSAQKYEQLQQTTFKYFNQLDVVKISHESLTENGINPVIATVMLVIGFPFFIIGLLINALPLLVIEGIWHKFGAILKDYEATFRAGFGGWFIVPICYGIMVHFLGEWIDFPFFGVFFWIFAVILGIFAWNYAIFFKHLSQRYYAMRISEQEKQNLLEQRSQVLTQLSGIIN